MAKTEYTKQMHAKQRSVIPEALNTYKLYIASAIIDEYKMSYKRPEDLKENWVYTFKYSKETEDFIIKKTSRFLTDLPIDGVYDSQKFLNDFTYKISEFLANYAYRATIVLTTKKFIECKKRIFDTIFKYNPIIQKRIKECNKNHQRINSEINLQARNKANNNIAVPEKPKCVHPTDNKRIRKTVADFRLHIEVDSDVPEPDAQLSKRCLRRKIAEKRKELAQLEKIMQSRTY